MLSNPMLSNLAPSNPALSNSAQSNPTGWEIIHNFATTDMGLPEAEGHLQQALGDDFVDSDWRPALKTVMDAEGDTEKALHNVQKLAACTHLPRIKIKIPAHAPKLVATEEALMHSVAELKGHNCIFGELLTINELVEPLEEKEIGYSLYQSKGGDDDIV